jgi:hypothetical protein
MRHKLRIACLWAAAILLSVSASGQTVPSTTAQAVPILQGSSLPMYLPIAKAAHVTGKLVVRVTVKDGLLVQTEVLSKPAVASGGRLLESPTIENLKTWRLAAAVTGAFTVTHTYEISGTEADDPTNSPPNRTIHARNCFVMFLRSFVAQRHHRVDAHRPPRWNPARYESDA